MDMVLGYKFTRHGDLRKELLSTGEAELIEDSHIDSFWGRGEDRKGQNQLGKALMRLRDKFREQEGLRAAYLRQQSEAASGRTEGMMLWNEGEEQGYPTVIDAGA